MADSILEDIKKLLGIVPDNTDFDVEIALHINSVLATLNQLGIGPNEGFIVEDQSATWADLLGADSKNANNVKIWAAYKVRMLFDPPQTAHLVAALKEQIDQLEWRINVRREGEAWVNPQPPSLVEPEVVIVPSREAWYLE